MRNTLALAFICLTAPVIATAQSSDAAAERARLANQRIQAEAARQAREEEQRQQELARLEAEEARLAAREATAAAEQDKQQLVQAAAPVTTPPRQSAAPAPTRNTNMDKVLEQLRTLGELRDAGYVTDDEFARIKKKILDATD